jgi:hypothetical protein
MSSKIIIKTGNLTVIDSGSVITFNNQPVDFILEDLLFRFNFESDKSSAPSIKVSTVPSLPKSLLITLVNYDSQIGLGNSNPFQLGTLNGKNIHMNFRVFNLENRADKVIHYSFYLEN